jgi:hypothetical protein
MVVGVRFAPFEGDIRTRLRAVLAERVLGPAVLTTVLSPARPGLPPARERDDVGRAAKSAVRAAPQRPTRVRRRVRYEKTVAAMEGTDAYILMCRDVSVGGMRIEPIDGLAVGSRLELAIQLSAPAEPIPVEASVVRDDGELGLALKFEWIAPGPKARLRELLAKLPSIEALQDDSSRQGTILAQRLPDKSDSPA